MVEDGLPELPLDYFDDVVPVPDEWSQETRRSYVWFTKAHFPDAREAGEPGWPVRHLVGKVVAMVTKPRTVAREVRPGRQRGLPVDPS